MKDEKAVISDANLLTEYYRVFFQYTAVADEVVLCIAVKVAAQSTNSALPGRAECDVE